MTQLHTKGGMKGVVLSGRYMLVVPKTPVQKTCFAAATAGVAISLVP